jgi:O-antigen/teichoic acid export membrane protein
MDIGFRMGIKLLLLAGLMLGVFGMFLADDVIGLFYGSRYIGAGGPLRVLLWSMMLSFLSFLLTNVNIAVDRQVENAYYAALVCTVSIGLNFVLIPPWGAMGSASARLIAEAIGCSFLAFRIRSVIRVAAWNLLFRALGFAAGLAVVLLLLRDAGPVVQVVGGGLAAAGLLFAIGMFSPAETERFRIALLGGRE